MPSTWWWKVWNEPLVDVKPMSEMDAIKLNNEQVYEPLSEFLPLWAAGDDERTLEDIGKFVEKQPRWD